jgi:hypothetical protein
MPWRAETGKDFVWECELVFVFRSRESVYRRMEIDRPAILRGGSSLWS